MQALNPALRLNLLAMFRVVHADTEIARFISLSQVGEQPWRTLGFSLDSERVVDIRGYYSWYNG
jgi:hypothetical protein